MAVYFYRSRVFDGLRLLRKNKIYYYTARAHITTLTGIQY